MRTGGCAIRAERYVVDAQRLQLPQRLGRRPAEDRAIGEDRLLQPMVGGSPDAVRRQRDDVGSKLEIGGDETGGRLGETANIGRPEAGPLGIGARAGGLRRIDRHGNAENATSSVAWLSSRTAARRMTAIRVLLF